MTTKYKIYENGVLRDMTPEEEAQKQASDNAWKNGGALEQALNNLRVERNLLLAETDYLALSDNTMTDEMKDYRQKLRDLTKGLTTEKKVKAKKFPTKP